MCVGCDIFKENNKNNNKDNVKNKSSGLFDRTY